MEKEHIDVQPIIYRLKLTQENVLNPTTIKSATYLSQQTVPPNINDNDTSATVTGVAIVAATDTTTASVSTVAVVAAVAPANNDFLN